jgi:hypothetical protein
MSKSEVQSCTQLCYVLNLKSSQLIMSLILYYPLEASGLLSPILILPRRK